MPIHSTRFTLIPEASLHAIVTDPPYGVKEYEHNQIEKRETGIGGVWRLPQLSMELYALLCLASRR